MSQQANDEIEQTMNEIEVSERSGPAFCSASGRPSPIAIFRRPPM